MTDPKPRRQYSAAQLAKKAARNRRRAYQFRTQNTPTARTALDTSKETRSDRDSQH